MKQIKTFFTSDISAMQYECNFSCDNAIFFKHNDEAYFITDSRYTLEAKECAKNVEVVESSDLIGDFIKIAKRAKNIIFDDNLLSVESFNRLNKSLSLKPLSNFHQELRIIKSDDEIALIKKSQLKNKKAFKKFAKFLNSLSSNTNELFLNFKAREFLQNNGKNPLSFEPITAINANAAKPHALPLKSTILKKGDLILFDAGVKHKFYCSDMTRSAFYGENISFSKEQKFKSKKMQKVYDIVLNAQESAIRKARSGMKAKDIDKIARDIISKAGYGEYFTHSCGHGVGLDIHELPRISTRSETIIQDGMVFSIEPGIYLPNEFGVRIEDLVVMRNGKAEVL